MPVCLVTPQMRVSNFRVQQDVEASARSEASKRPLAEGDAESVSGLRNREQRELARLLSKLEASAGLIRRSSLFPGVAIRRGRAPTG